MNEARSTSGIRSVRAIERFAMKNILAMIAAFLLTAMSSFCGTDETGFSKWYEQGVEHVKERDLPSAKQCFTRALRCKPDDADAQRALDMTEERLDRQYATQPNTTPIPLHAETTRKSNKTSGLRVAVRNHPGISEGEYDWYVSTGINDNYVLQYHEQEGVQLDIMYVKRFLGRDGRNRFGGSVGGGLFYANASGQGAAGEVDLTGVGLVGEGAVVYRLLESFILEMGGALGVGVADLESTSFGVSEEYENATYLSWTVKGGAYCRLSANMEIGIEVGYMLFESSAEEDRDGTIADLTYSGDGFQGGVVLAMSF